MWGCFLLKGSGWTVRSTKVKRWGHFSGLKILNDFLNLFFIFFNLKHFHEVDWSFRFSFEFWTEFDPFHLKPEKNEDFLLSSKLWFRLDVVEFNCAPGVFWRASWNNFVKSVGLSHDGVVGAIGGSLFYVMKKLRLSFQRKSNVWISDGWVTFELQTKKIRLNFNWTSSVWISAERQYFAWVLTLCCYRMNFKQNSWPPYVNCYHTSREQVLDY